MTKQRVTFALLGLLFAATIFFTLYSLAVNDVATGLLGLFAIFVNGFLIYGTQRNWPWLPYAIVILLAVVVAFSADLAYMRTQISLTLLIPVICAAILLTPLWTIGTFLITLMLLLTNVSLRSGGFDPVALGPTYQPVTLVMLFVISCGIALVSSVSSHALHLAQASERLAQDALAQTKVANHELEHRASELALKTNQQQELLALVSVLETPALTLADDVLIAPLVGHIDTRRANDLRARLLETAHAQRTKLVVIDVSGISVIDTAVARALLETARALRLLGCSVTISGISAQVALTLTTMGVDLGDVATTRNPQEALRQYLAQAPEEEDIASLFSNL